MAARKKNSPKPEEVISEEARQFQADGYETVTGGSGEPWQAGGVAVGTFKGIRDSEFQQDDGEFAKLVDIDTENGPRTFRCPAVLANRLERVSVGDDVRIECRGKIRTKAGRNAWDFLVQVKRNSPAPTVISRAVVARPKRGRRTK